MIIALALLLSVLATSVDASTMYVRPGSGHGAGDGTSYGDAFDDFNDVSWGTNDGQLGPGDTLKVCGVFVVTALQAKHSGAVDLPITLDGDCRADGEPGISRIDGTVNHLNNTMQLLTNRWEFGGGASNEGYQYLIFKNLIVVVEAGPGITRGGVKINATSAPGVVDRTVDTFVILDNIHIYMVGVFGDELQDCVNGRGSHTRITNSSIHDCTHDAVYWEGNFNEIDHSIIARPDLKTGVPGGDCVQFGGAVGIQNTGNWIHHNVMDHSNKATKQVIILSGDSDLPMFNVVEDNLLIGASSVVNYNPSGGIIQRNLMIGIPGMTRVLNIERQFGTNLAGNAVTLADNILVAHPGTVGSFGIFVTMPSSTIPYEILAYRNIVVGFQDTGIRMFATPLSARVANNIVHSTAGTYAFSFGSATVTKNDYNTWYGTANKWQGGGAPDASTHDSNLNVTSIPIPTNYYQPPNYFPVRIPRLDARSLTFSPAWTAGSGW